MIRRFVSVASAAMLVPTLAWADFGAIAFSPGSGAHGYSYARSSRRDAENRALNNCLRYADDCEVVLYFSNACGALAVGENYGYGVAWTGSKNSAQSRALRACQARDDGCRVLRWACSG